MKTIVELVTAILVFITALINLRSIHSNPNKKKTMTEKTIAIMAIVAVFAMVIMAICYLSKKP